MYEIETKKFKKMLDMVKSCYSESKILPLTSVISIKINNSKLTLRVSNIRTTIEVTDNSTNINSPNMSALVNYKQFSSLIKNITSDTIVFDVISDSLYIKANGEYKLSMLLGLDNKPFKLSNLNTDFDNTIKLTINKPQDLVKLGKDFLSDEPQYSLYHNFYIKDKAIAGNGYKFAIINGPPVVSEFPIILHTGFLKQLSVFSKKTVEIDINSKLGYFYIYDTVDEFGVLLYCNKLEYADEYNYSDIVELGNYRNYLEICEIDLNRFKSLIGRLETFIAEDVYLQFEGDCIIFGDSDKTIIEKVQSMSIPVEVAGKTFKLSLEHLNIINSSASGDSIKLYCNKDYVCFMFGTEKVDYIVARK